MAPFHVMWLCCLVTFLTVCLISILTSQLTEINKSIAAMDKLLEDLESDVYSVNSDDVENNNEAISMLPSSAVIEYSNQFFVMVSDACFNTDSLCLLKVCVVIILPV